MSQVPKMSLGNKIRLIRELKGYKQDYLAEKLGMTQNGYGKIERDETDVAYSRLEKIAEVLEISPADLLNIDSQKIQLSISNQNNTNATFNQAYLLNNMQEKLINEQRIESLEKEIVYLKEIIDLLKQNK